MELFQLNAEPRQHFGKGASRRMRHHNQVPAILYGGEKDPVALTLTHNELYRRLQEDAFYSHILTVTIGNKSEKAVLRDVQHHPYKQQILHIDLQRIKQKEQIRMHVPLHFINGDKAVGVKEQGGIINTLRNEIEVSCLPKHLPEAITIDLAELSLGESIHLSDVATPEGVVFTDLAQDQNPTLVSLQPPKADAPADDDESAGDDIPAE